MSFCWAARRSISSPPRDFSGKRNSRRVPRTEEKASVGRTRCARRPWERWRYRLCNADGAYSRLTQRGAVLTGAILGRTRSECPLAPAAMAHAPPKTAFSSLTILVV
jgi:hypothetical protein